MKHLSHLSRKETERGQSLVEFALMFPVLLLIMAGAVDLARAYDAYVTITNAAREGARFGSNNPARPDDIKAQVNAELAGTGITLSADPTIACFAYADNSARDCNTTALSNAAVAGDQIKVTVTYTFHSILGSITGFQTIPLSNYAVMAISN